MITVLVRILIGVAAWALLVGVIVVFIHGCSTGRQRVEGGRPEDRL